MNALNKVLPRIKYYLLDWKDHNINKFLNKYGDNVRLNDLNKEQLIALFNYATNHDNKILRGEID